VKLYGVHANSIHKWKKEFLEKGAEGFDQEGQTTENERHIADLEQLLGRKEIETALLKTS
jgi:transposase-like protein